MQKSKAPSWKERVVLFSTTTKKSPTWPAVSVLTSICLKKFVVDLSTTPWYLVLSRTHQKVVKPIYHTNVLMCMTDRYAVLCLDAIDDLAERTMVTDTIRKSGKEVIEISEAQKHQFGGNMLLVKGDGDALHLVMSTSAFKCLTNAQKAQIEGYHKILHSDLTTIETLGGGSARCMLAEIYLPKQP